MDSHCAQPKKQEKKDRIEEGKKIGVSVFGINKTK